MLCARRERPRGGTAEQRDELATSDESWHLVPPVSEGLQANYSISAFYVPPHAFVASGGWRLHFLWSRGSGQP
jgi:hypothetical protein